VQHWVEDAPDDPSDAYKAVACQACTKLHFINISNGRLLGETEKAGSVGGPFHLPSVLAT